MNTRDHFVLASIFGSVIIHGLIVLASQKVDLPAIHDIITRDKQTFQLNAANIPPMEQRSQKPQQDILFERLAFEKPHVDSSMPFEPGVRVAHDDQSTIDDMDFQTHTSHEKIHSFSPLSTFTSMPKQVRNRFEDQIQTIQLAARDDHPVLPSITSGHVEEQQTVDARLSSPPSQHSLESPGREHHADRSAVQSRIKETLVNELTQAPEPYVNIDAYFDIELRVSPGIPGEQRYFQLTIHPGQDAQKLAKMPKELTVLVDCSLSIYKKRLSQFIAGLKEILLQLNPDDVFNIIAFSESVMPFSDKAVPATRDNIYKALHYVTQLKPTAGTNVYDALEHTINQEPVLEPSYIVFFSDGHPTYGRRDAPDIIRALTQRNQQRRSIFAFSGGDRVNQYLLDFLAYQNRGWSEHANSIENIDSQIQQFYQKIEDPLLVNVRYQFSQISDKDIYPKHLPDLYRGTSLTLYGRFDKAIPFSMQLIGDIGTEHKGVLYQADLSTATQGDDEIPKKWAFHKMYDMVSQWAMYPNDASLYTAMTEHQQQHRISMPYLPQRGDE